jgi:hypothetical protein
MTWLERVRQKNFAPATNGRAKSTKSQEVDHKNLEAYESGSAKSAKRDDEASSVIFGTAEPVGPEVFVTPSPTFTREVIIVAYQRFILDYDLPDGTYTPQELRRAKLLVKPGPVLRYRLHWPGGTPQPITGRESMTADHRKRA